MTLLTEALSAVNSVATTVFPTVKQTTSSPFSSEPSPLSVNNSDGSLQEEGATSFPVARGSTTEAGGLEQDRDDTEAPNSELIESLQKQLLEQEAERREDLTTQLDETFKRNLKLSFSVDEETGTNVFQLIDEDTGNIVKRYPPEEFLNFIKNFKAVSGMILREDA